MFGLIKKYDVHMCSEVKGVITLNGNPVEGVLINRGEEYELWNSELRGIDEPDEYKQKLSSLNADLVSPNVDFIFPNHTHENLDFYGSTICRWESDFEIYETEDDDTDYFKDFK